MTQRYLPKVWDPFEELMQWNKALERLAAPGMMTGEGQPTNWAVPLDVVESDNHYRITIEVPGIDPKDLKVEVQGGVLSVQGERREEKAAEGEQVQRRELVYGSFMRQLRLPEAVEAEKIEANYRNGLLELRLPKRENERKRLINVKVNNK